MDTFILVLHILLYVVAIALLVVLTVLGVKGLKILDKVDTLVDDLNEKAESLDGLFNAIDKLGDGIDSFTTSFILKTTKLLSIFKKTKKKKEDKEYE